MSFNNPAISIRLQALPTELQDKILKLCLAGQWNGKIPGLITALHSTKLYNEACAILIKTNIFVLSSRNGFSIGALKEERLAQIKNIVIKFGKVLEHGDMGREYRPLPRFSTTTLSFTPDITSLTRLSNLEELTINLQNLKYVPPRNHSNFYKLIERVLSISKNMKRIRLKLAPIVPRALHVRGSAAIVPATGIGSTLSTFQLSNVVPYPLFTHPYQPWITQTPAIPLLSATPLALQFGNMQPHPPPLPPPQDNDLDRRSIMRLSWELDVRGVLETVGMTDEEVWVWDIANANAADGRRFLDLVQVPVLAWEARREGELDFMVGR